jgi:DNA replication protein DnaC
MMTADKCQKLLQDRVSWARYSAKSPDGTLMHGHDALYLMAGDLVYDSGWTPRELAAVRIATKEPPRSVATKEKRLQARSDYWFPLWDQQVLERYMARSKKEAEARRAAALDRWVKFGPPPRYAARDLDDFDIETDAQRAIVKKVAAFPDRVGNDPGSPFDVLALLGTPGTRKTQLAASWLRAWVVDVGADGQFVNAGRLVADARDAGAVARYCTVEHLVLDDIGADPNDAGVVVKVIDARLGNNLTTVFTSNATPAQLEDIYGPRGLSRLTCNALMVVLAGRDWRRDPQALLGVGVHEIQTPPRSSK